MSGRPARGDGANRGVAVALRDVVHLYPTDEGDVVALRGIHLDVEPGATVALLGPSGAGKSTVLALLAGDTAPSSGQVLVGGEDLARVGSARLAALRATTISLVAQGAERNLLLHATVAENVWFAQRGAVARRRQPALGVRELLDAFESAPLADRICGELTAGQQQLAAVMAGVAASPGLLLLDEPTNRLDEDARLRVLAAISTIADRFGATVVLVTHDPVAAAAMGRTVTIRDGRVGAEGRDGGEYAVVGQDGSVQLTGPALSVAPPGSLVEVLAADGRVVLRPAGGGGGRGAAGGGGGRGAAGGGGVGGP